ncbi:hypothetical protein H6P81_012260 [Aristolochia fimbriata]|uniref:Uncharacterized protein n=1 Tax=Aristolochia fimbriata TaxID=158543 RepID=A0AAV7EEJ4_ARIFI|nr:hypothetical protein H6P81_012260 [Aristolochia fimbriata]
MKGMFLCHHLCVKRNMGIMLVGQVVQVAQAVIQGPRLVILTVTAPLLDRMLDDLLGLKCVRCRCAVYYRERPHLWDFVSMILGWISGSCFGMQITSIYMNRDVGNIERVEESRQKGNVAEHASRSIQTLNFDKNTSCKIFSSISKFFTKGLGAIKSKFSGSALYGS